MPGYSEMQCHTHPLLADSNTAYAEAKADVTLQAGDLSKAGVPAHSLNHGTLAGPTGKDVAVSAHGTSPSSWRQWRLLHD